MSEKDIAVLRNELDHMNRSIQDLHDLLAKHIEKEEIQMERLLENLDKKYSSKWVERAFITIFTTSWLAVLWALIALVIK